MNLFILVKLTVMKLIIKTNLKTKSGYLYYNNASVRKRRFKQI